MAIHLTSSVPQSVLARGLSIFCAILAEIVTRFGKLVHMVCVWQRSSNQVKEFSGVFCGRMNCNDKQTSVF
ncbi:hypothetical protein DUNSADRAFT_410 [Dunaliella salina]|uniref:Secreted protein n=1 Tax=Dunaliella salina TaxID=3046 RepID=A0ABQ7FYZ1_DUNSA|nr:hypothetical protein DUNSADRAFT_410 [Dunaliella salina]|eukprot:KAF5827578.1 hypothetical protein DUNSADRAFT_410 [Dunaliella salina]